MPPSPASQGPGCWSWCWLVCSFSFFFFSRRGGGGPCLGRERDLCLTHSLSLSAFAWGGDYAVFPCPELNSGKGGDFFPKVFLALRVWLTLHNFCATWLPPFWLSQKGREPFLFGLFHRVWLTLHNFAGTLFPLSEFNLDRGKRVPFLFQKFNIEGLAHIAQLWTTYHPMRSRSQTPKHEHSHTHT